MHKLLNPKWLYAIHTLPLALLGLVLYSDYEIIDSLLEEKSLYYWKVFAMTVGTLGVMNVFYAVWATFTKQTVSTGYAFATISLHSGVIYLFLYHSAVFTPFNIPNWMLSTQPLVYVITFLTPSIIYGLFILVFKSISEQSLKSMSSFLGALAVPFGAYLIVQILIPIFSHFNLDFDWLPTEYMAHAAAVFTIAITFLFLFCLIRGFYILAVIQKRFHLKEELFWKIPVGIIFPLLGLAINQGYVFGGKGVDALGIFGDFDSPWFFIIAFLNGLFFCLPSKPSKNYRLALFTARSVTFSYIFYFFLVFLPFLPLSIVAILVVGFGFLMLTPIALFIVQLGELSHDIDFLAPYYGKTSLRAIAIAGFLILPAALTLSNLHHRSTLHEALAYVYSPKLSEKPDIDLSSLERTLYSIIDHKDTRARDAFEQQTPYLSSYFNWLVLDNLTLSNSKINKLERIFFDQESVEINRAPIQKDSTVQITDIVVESKFDERQNAWLSWVHFEITNDSKNSWRKEFATQFELPTGCWISDHYLYVGDRKEEGILAERRTAQWVFNNIRNENRDPSILYYLNGNQIHFQVFPFQANEVRKTGIQFVHKSPVAIQINEHLVKLGNSDQPQQEDFENETVAFISAKSKERLPKADRKPYLHLLVDVSSDRERPEIEQELKTFLQSVPEYVETSKISFVDHTSLTVEEDENWKEVLYDLESQGGFYLERAIRTALIEAYQTPSDSYPVFVAITDSWSGAIADETFADLALTYPENPYYFVVEEGVLSATASLSNKNVMVRYNHPDSATSISVEQLLNAYPDSFHRPVVRHQLSDGKAVFLPMNQQASIVLKKDFFKLDTEQITAKSWESGLMMQGKLLDQALHPEITEADWLTQVKASFLSQIMMPVTSYIAVENEAQKTILKKKQNQVLAGNPALDLSEDTRRMSEPSMLIMGLLLVAFWWLRNRKKHRLVTNQIDEYN